MRLIDADALMKKATNAKKYDPEMMVVGLGYVYSAPTIDPVKHGRWIYNRNSENFVCSVCNGEAYCPDTFGEPIPEKTAYCPHCGAKMDADEVKP